MVHNDTYLGTSTKKHDEISFKKCDYSTCHLGLWKRHLQTKKHNGTKMVHDDTSKAPKSTTSASLVTNTYLCECGRSYKYHSGYYRHKSKCTFKIEDKPEVVISKTNNTDYREMYEQKLEENLELAHEIIRKQQKALDEITNSSNQSNNNNSFNTINNNNDLSL